MFLDFIKYFAKAKNAHGIHSPFIFDFYTKVYKDKNKSIDFQLIEEVRKELRNNSGKIKVTDFGAGSKLNRNRERAISDIARKSLKSKFWSQLFYKIIQHYKYTNILELGTSLGISTAYLSKANPIGKVWTFEGCGETLNVAQETLKKVYAENTLTISGNIDETLPEVLSTIESLDFVLFDANHRYEPTLRYFEECYPKGSENACFIFDDIYWSEEMKAAWQEIVNDKRVSLSIDLFYIGIAFFRKGVEKQHFILK